MLHFCSHANPEAENNVTDADGSPTSRPYTPQVRLMFSISIDNASFLFPSGFLSWSAHEEHRHRQCFILGLYGASSGVSNNQLERVEDGCALSLRVFSSFWGLYGTSSVRVETSFWGLYGTSSVRVDKCANRPLSGESMALHRCGLRLVSGDSMALHRCGLINVQTVHFLGTLWHFIGAG
jgi:hypothetical protein